MEKRSYQRHIWVLVRFACSLLSLISFIMACDLFDQKVKDACLVVGSTHITSDRLKRDMEFICAGMEVSPQQKPLILDQLLDQCINHYLILEHAEKTGISVTDRELQDALKEIRTGYSDDAFDEALLRGYVDPQKWQARLKEQMLVEKTLGKVAEHIPMPSYQEIKAYFEANQDQFMSSKMVDFRQIVTQNQEEADAILKRIRNGEQMSELAKNYSVAPEAEDGGRVGWVAEENLAEPMRKALFSLPQNKISAVIQSPYGYHIFQVLAVKPAGPEELSDNINEIKLKLFNENRENYIKNWLEDLRHQYEVQVNRDLINKMEFS